MKNKKRMYNMIYRIRKSGGVNIDTRKRTIFYTYQNTDSGLKMNDNRIVKLCKEFGFVRQAIIN